MIRDSLRHLLEQFKDAPFHRLQLAVDLLKRPGRLVAKKLPVEINFITHLADTAIQNSSKASLLIQASGTNGCTSRTKKETISSWSGMFSKSRKVGSGSYTTASNSSKASLLIQASGTLFFFAVLGWINSATGIQLF